VPKEEVTGMLLKVMRAGSMTLKIADFDNEYVNMYIEIAARWHLFITFLVSSLLLFF
jgi:hypothetical protein